MRANKFSQPLLMKWKKMAKARCKFLFNLLIKEFLNRHLFNQNSVVCRQNISFFLSTNVRMMEDDWSTHSTNQIASGYKFHSLFLRQCQAIHTQYPDECRTKDLRYGEKLISLSCVAFKYVSFLLRCKSTKVFNVPKAVFWIM